MGTFISKCSLENIYCQIKQQNNDNYSLNKALKIYRVQVLELLEKMTENGSHTVTC